MSAGRKKNGRSGGGDKITWDDIWRIGLGLLGYNIKELGVLKMRHLANALEGYADKRQESWEQARLISYYSAFPHLKKGFKLSDISIPGDNAKSNGGSQQSNKKEVYKLLEKWNK